MRPSPGLGEAGVGQIVAGQHLQHTRDAVSQLAHAQGILGLIMADQIAQDIEVEPWIRAPRPMLHRMARYMEVAAGLVEDGVIGYDTDPAEARGLPDALGRDAELLRSLAANAH